MDWIVFYYKYWLSLDDKKLSIPMAPVIQSLLNNENKYFEKQMVTK